MRKETITCDECKEVISGKVLVLEEITVSCWEKGKRLVTSTPLVGPGATEGARKPDFCGVPCMTKWISVQTAVKIKGVR